MGSLLLLLIPSLIWPFVAKKLWPHEITWGELAINIAVGLAITSVAFGVSRHISISDTAYQNAPLVSKNSERVSCEHSYTCNCRESCSGSGESRSCSTTCDTCYDHLYDVNWLLNSALGSVKVPRVNRQGTVEPPRYKIAAKDDAMTIPYSYQNYVKSAPDSLFSGAAYTTLKEEFKGVMPAYPENIYDLHYLNRVLAVNLALPEESKWNSELATMLAKTGVSTTANAVVVFANVADRNFGAALRAHWIGAKHNELVVVIGVTDYPEIAWVDVFGWSESELAKVQLRDDVLELKTVDRPAVLALISKTLNNGFVPRSPEDFAYLEDEIELPTWIFVLLLIGSGGLSFGLSMVLASNSITSGYRTRRFRPLRR